MTAFLVISMFVTVCALLMTGFPSEQIREQAGAAEITHFLEKPFSLEDVKAAIAEAVAEGSTDESDTD